MFTTTVRSMLLALPVAALLSLTAASPANAHNYQPHYHLKTVTVYETRHVHQTIYVNVYDDYGHVRRVPKTIHKTIRVPVTRTIKVYH